MNEIKQLQDDFELACANNQNVSLEDIDYTLELINLLKTIYE